MKVLDLIRQYLREFIPHAKLLGPETIRGVSTCVVYKYTTTGLHNLLAVLLRAD